VSRYYLATRTLQHQPDTKFVWQLTTGRVITPPRGVEQVDYQSRRACGFFLARLVDARQPVFIGKRDPKCPRKHALAYTAFTPQRLYLSATSSPPSGFYAYVVIGGWVLQAPFHRLEARNIPTCPTARPHLLESTPYRCYTSLASRKLPAVTTKKAPRIPRLKTSQKGREDAQDKSRRAQWPHCHARMK
jgi:hypothetical protein